MKDSIMYSSSCHSVTAALKCSLLYAYTFVVH